MKRPAALGFTAIVTACLLAVTGVATTAVAAGTDSASDTARIKHLQKRLDERDALIRDLLRRVKKLEREEGARSRGKTEEARAEGKPAARSRQAAEAPQPQNAAAAPPTSAAPRSAPQQPAPPPPARASASAQSAPAPEGGPGSFSVSPEAAERALERALVQSGAALLEPWKAEFVPSFSYQWNQISQPNQLALTTTGTVLVSNSVRRFNQMEAAGLIRLGLPWETQAELRFPYDFKSLSTTTAVAGTGLSEQIVDAHGYGDPILDVTKQLMTERDYFPSLFVSGLVEPNAGQTDKGIPLGMGFDQFRVGLIATKRQDPLVFTAGFTYQTALQNKGIVPGDQYTPSVGLLFAVSPETSLQFSQQLTWARPIERNHITIPGSNQLSGAFNVGLLSILGPGLVLNLGAAIGETPDAPNLTLQVSFPIKLN